MITHVYIDVDGVLNAVNTNPPPWGWPDHARTTADRTPVLYSPTMIAALNRLNAHPNTRFHWLTTWDNRAPQHLAPAIGLHGDHWPVVGTRYHYATDTPDTWWKVRAISHHTTTTRPDAVAWVDDDIATDTDALNWLNTQTIPTLAIAPNCHVGLTRGDTHELDTFLQTQSA